MGATLTSSSHGLVGRKLVYNTEKVDRKAIRKRSCVKAGRYKELSWGWEQGNEWGAA